MLIPLFTAPGETPAVETGSAVIWPYLYRGMEVYGGRQPAAAAFGSIFLESPGLKLEAVGTLALAGRAGAFETSRYDEIRWTVTWKRRFFPEGLFEAGAGFSGYHFLNLPITAYGAFVPEPFITVGLPGLLLQPALQVYLDLTPRQTGFYWGLDLRHTFALAEEELQLVLGVYRADDYLKQERANFLYYLFVQGSIPYFLESLVPCQVSLDAALPIDLPGGWRIVPAAEVCFIPMWTWNSRWFEFGFTLGVSRLWGDVPFRHRELR